MSYNGPQVTWGDFIFSADSGYPAPMVSISRQYAQNGGGDNIGSSTTVSLEGKIFDTGNLLGLENNLRLNFSSGLYRSLTIPCIGNILASGQEQTNDLFTVNRYSANKSTDNWAQTIDYSIELIAYHKHPRFPSGTSGNYVSSIEDTWNIEIIEDNSYWKNDDVDLTSLGYLAESLSANNTEAFPLYRITRALGAVGIKTQNLTALESAQRWVKENIDFKPEFYSQYTLYNLVKNVESSELGGSYKINFSWLGALTSKSLPSYMETFTIESNIDSSLLRTVTVQGKVMGLKVVPTGMIAKNSVSTGGSANSITKLDLSSTSSHDKFQNAKSGYEVIKPNIYGRISSLIKQGERTLHPTPISITEGFSPTEGSVTYNWQFNNRPLNLINQSISESLTIRENSPTIEIARVFVLGRRLGPILLNMGTVSTSSKTVTFEAVLPRPSSITTAKFPKEAFSAIESLVNSYQPEGNNFAGYIKENSTDWNISEGRFTRTKTWEWTQC